LARSAFQTWGGGVSDDVRAIAIPRLDPPGHGVHVVWSGLDLLPLAVDGYEVRRRVFKRGKTSQTCAVFDAQQLSELERFGYLPDTLGTILCRPGTWPVRHLGIPSPVPANSPALAAEQQGSRSAAAPRPAAVLPTPFPAAGADTPVLVFTQELAQPSDSVSVACESKAAFLVAASAGKGVSLQTIPPSATVAVTGAAIDSVSVYAVSPGSLQICTQTPADPAQDAHDWAGAEVIAQGLTLPLRETDPSLAARADELARARARLIAGETLTDAEADSLANALRMAAARADLGRPCDRVMLSRADPGDAFQEILFSARIALLTLDPRLRRVLGYGCADVKVAEGQTYEYRVSGRFDAADLMDEIYDVHNVPSGTSLPMAIRIRDLALAFPAPATVVLEPAPAPAALTAVSRRAIALESSTDPVGFLGGDLLGDLACVIDLPRPCLTVVLEVAAGHDLRYAGAQADDSLFPLTEPLPAGPVATLSFPAPVDQIRLAGTGSLYAVRIPSGATGRLELACVSAPVTFQAEPLPYAPPWLATANLQTPPAVLTGPIDEQTVMPARPQPGFELAWMPQTISPLGVWPEDLTAGPPLEASTHQIEHQRLDGPNGPDPWEPIQAGDNLTYASWPTDGSRPRLAYGVDLDAAFPAQAVRDAGSPLVLTVTDVLGVIDPDTGETRNPAPLGSLHRYRIRAVDVVGRTSDTWTLSAPARLEKHVPPPLPVGPQPPPLPDEGRSTGPAGVRARAILSSDPALTDADRAVLAGHGSAVVLEWGWRDAERELDPLTHEFRVYLQQRPPTEIPGIITSVASEPGLWVVGFTTDRVLAADECEGQWLDSGEATFRIVGHTGGSAIQITLAADALNPGAAPALGPTTFGRRLAPDHQRPAGWQERVAVVPLAASDSYSHVLHDVLTVDATVRKQTIWVGVSAADAESYIPDELPGTATNGGRPGNESSIAAVSVTGTYRGRPSFSMPQPLGDIPEVVGDEPTGRKVGIGLDGSSLLAGALPASALVALDRCPANEVLAVTRIDASGNVTMLRADGSLQTVVFPNAADEAAVTAALSSDHPERLASRYVLFLLGHFDQPGQLLTRTGDALQPLGGLTDALDPRPGRYFYRVRPADAGGAVAAGGAILPVVARVPSTAPAPAPRRVGLSLDAGLALTVDVDPDPELSWVLLFVNIAPWNDTPSDPARAQLVRIPNRRDLYPANGIRLRLAEGTLLAPVAKSLADPDVTAQPGGVLRVTVTGQLPSPTSDPLMAQYWCYALSRDGIPSRGLEPRSIGLGTA
jgi:hypothetical protein